MSDEIQGELFPVIEHSHQGQLIPQRAKDGYVNATALCKAAGKKWNHYVSNATTQAFVEELVTDTGIPASELIQSIKGGRSHEQGTWVHPYVAINLGQWLNPAFAVKVSKWITEWMSGGPEVVERLPYHLRRYVANMTQIPKGHFSVLQELTYGLIAPMEAEGYTLPENMVPDISEGRMFAGWLRKEKGINPKTFPKYPHQYEDGRVVAATAYPNSLLEDFRHHFNNVWLPQRSQKYFEERDAVAVTYLTKLLPSPT